MCDTYIFRPMIYDMYFSLSNNRTVWNNGIAWQKNKRRVWNNHIGWKIYFENHIKPVLQTKKCTKNVKI